MESRTTTRRSPLRLLPFGPDRIGGIVARSRPSIPYMTKIASDCKGEFYDGFISSA